MLMALLVVASYCCAICSFSTVYCCLWFVGLNIGLVVSDFFVFVDYHLGFLLVVEGLNRLYCSLSYCAFFIVIIITSY